jgi:hypothetical protein
VTHAPMAATETAQTASTACPTVRHATIQTSVSNARTPPSSLTIPVTPHALRGILETPRLGLANPVAPSVSSAPTPAFVFSARMTTSSMSPQVPVSNVLMAINPTELSALAADQPAVSVRNLLVPSVMKDTTCSIISATPHALMLTMKIRQAEPVSNACQAVLTAQTTHFVSIAVLSLFGTALTARIVLALVLRVPRHQNAKLVYLETFS